MTFVDSSGVYAQLDEDDKQHMPAASIWTRLITTAEPLVTTSYVVLELTALLQRRLGIEAVRALHENLLPFIDIQWVGPELHTSAMAALLTANRRQLSLVDCVSFATMRRLGIRDAFAFDEHFAEQGFRVLAA